MRLLRLKLQLAKLSGEIKTVSFFSHTSASTILGVPADVYAFGGSYIFATVSIIFSAFFTNFAFMPVFHRLQITSTYEYLGLRFDEKIKKCCTVLYALAMSIHLPVIIHIGALAFSAGKYFI